MMIKQNVFVMIRMVLANKVEYVSARLDIMHKAIHVLCVNLNVLHVKVLMIVKLVISHLFPRVLLVAVKMVHMKIKNN